MVSKIILLPAVLFIFFNQSIATFVTYNIVKLGARPDGVTDTSNTFLTAWASACTSPVPARIYIPRGRYLLQKAIIFEGPCKTRAISIRIDGTLVAPPNYSTIGNSTFWIQFKLVTGVSVRGGFLDGRGAGLWACKTSGKDSCPRGATSLGFLESRNIKIAGLTSVNSQLFHIVINDCQNVKLQGVKVLASGISPNTDAIHVQMSSEVRILNSKLSTGDDCVSIGPGTTNLWIENVICGPGHGISIGSLAKEYEELGVQNITVRKVTLVNTTNGVRIKTWGRPSTGFVRNVIFQHILLVHVHNPIIIDQNYCPHHYNCPGKVSGIKISDVEYKDIHGTSTSQVAVKFDCSSAYPCTRMKLEDVRLSYVNGTAKAFCNNAIGTASGLIEPSSCL